MPTLNVSPISSQQKTTSSSTPQQQGSKYKSDEIIKDSDDEGDVLPPSNGNQNSESKRKHKDRSIRTLTAKASAAISTGSLTRKRKRDILSTAVIDSSEIRSGIEDSVKGIDNELSKSKEKKYEPSRTRTHKQLLICSRAKKKREPTESASRYRPPSGFEHATITVRPNSSLAELFSPARLRNKQIWHIAVPSSVPIDSLTEFSTTNVQIGDTVLSYKGADFGLVLQPKSRTAKKALLLPSAETNEYRPVEVEIARTLQLQQLPPKRSNSSGATLNAATSNEKRRSKKAPPQQPDGLRMRYHPFGVTEYSSDESQPENQTHVPKFRRLPGIETSPPMQIQTGESIDVEMHDVSQKPRSKHKKKRDAVNLETHKGFSESHHNRTRDSVARGPPGNKHKRTSDTGDVQMTEGSPQPLPPPSMLEKQNRESIGVKMNDVISDPQSTPKLKRKKKPQANSELGIDAPAATDSGTEAKFSGIERKRKKDRYTRSDSSRPANEQRRNNASTTKYDQDLHTTRPGTIDLANLGNGEKEHKHKKKRHAKPDAIPVPEKEII